MAMTTSPNPPGDDRAGDAVDALLELLERRRPLLTSRADFLPRQLAAAGLTYAEALLKASRTLVQSGHAQSAGILLRTIWECWCVGSYLLLKGDEAVEQVRRYHDFRLGQMKRGWDADVGGGDPFEGLDVDVDAPREEWNLRAMAAEVEDAQRRREGELFRPTDTSSYETLYRFESQWGSHAGWGPFNRYLTVLPDVDRIEIDPRPRIMFPEDGGIAFAAVWVARLAYDIFRAFGIGLREISVASRDVFTAARAAGPFESS
jgi:hypothetical protein